MSQLPPDLMRQDRPTADSDAVGDSGISAPNHHGDETDGQRYASRIPLVLSSVAFLMSLAAGGLAGFTYENGSRSVKAELAALDRRLTEAEMVVAQFTGDVDLKLSNLVSVVRELESDLATLNDDLDQFRALAAEQNARIGGVEGAVSDIETFVKSLSARAAPQKKPSKSTRTAPRKAADVALLSVRSIGDIAVVRIGSASGQSPLLQIGDSWQQWEFVGIDGAGAQFKRNGHNVRLAL